MTSLYEAFVSNNGRTYNGAVTRTTSSNPCVDLFFNIGSMRGATKDALNMFYYALGYDENRTLRILQWLRDVRGGAGERQLYRAILKSLEDEDHPAMQKLIAKTPMIGRWDDILIFEKEVNRNEAYSMIMYELTQNNALCAKWMPRKGPVFNDLRKWFAVTPKQLRKALVERTNVVETKMCKKQWDDIEFGKLPSLAALRYQKAFERNAPNKYHEYLEALKKGEDKINASTLYPYNLVDINYGYRHVTVASDEQWKALPDYMKETEERVLPLVDVSASMYTGIGNNTTAISVAVSLGLYMSERIEGPFKDCFMTFSSTPQLQKLYGTLSERCKQLVDSHWGMSTDISKAMTTLLNSAKAGRVPQSEMPTMIVILSDMEFDSSYISGKSVRALSNMRDTYRRFGYKMPKIVFWNLDGRIGNVPARTNESGVALISGFSPSIMKSVLSCKKMTPEAIMDETIMIDRYKL